VSPKDPPTHSLTPISVHKSSTRARSLPRRAPGPHHLWLDAAVQDTWTWLQDPQLFRLGAPNPFLSESQGVCAGRRVRVGPEEAQKYNFPTATKHKPGAADKRQPLQMDGA